VLFNVYLLFYWCGCFGFGLRVLVSCLIVVRFLAGGCILDCVYCVYDLFVDVDCWLLFGLQGLFAFAFALFVCFWIGIIVLVCFYLFIICLCLRWLGVCGLWLCVGCWLCLLVLFGVGVVGLLFRLFLRSVRLFAVVFDFTLVVNSVVVFVLYLLVY